MKRLFLAFPTYQVKSKRRIKKFNNYELWNLEKISEEEFIDLIQKAIRPLNRNVRNNYFFHSDRRISEKSYKKSSWGLLLPDYSSGNLNIKDESLLAVNLYSDLFQPLMFYVGVMGISVTRRSIELQIKSGFHGEDGKFAKRKFSDFYNTVLPEIIGTRCRLPDIQKWDREKWRLSIACLLYNRLEKYQRSFQILTWQNQCVDIVTMHEALLSRHKRDTGKYRIIQRIEVLLANHYRSKFPEIKKSLENLFDYRNEFVHGSFFERLKKQTKSYSYDTGIAHMTQRDFNFLGKQKEIARKVFICFLYIRKKLKSTRNKELRKLTIPEIINKAIMDTKLRVRIQQYVNEILKLAYF